MHTKNNDDITTFGTILNDDIELINEFECTNDGIIFSATKTDADFTSSRKIDLETHTINNAVNIDTRQINAIGYNVNDDFLYGIGFKSKLNKTIDVLKINKNYETRQLEVKGLPQGKSLYALGDVDFHDTLYVSTIMNESGKWDYLKSLFAINLKTLAVKKIDLDFSNASELHKEGGTYIYSADYAFNPIDEMLYTIDADLKQLVRIDPHSGKVELLGDVGLPDEDVYSVTSFFDGTGRYFFTNKSSTKMYKINIGNPNNINPQASLYIDNLELPSNGDGAKCAYAKLPLRGKFNIERTDSGDYKINTPERNAWYTQIVKRDFDYSLVFYDDKFEAEKNVSDATVKIELMF